MEPAANNPLQVVGGFVAGLGLWAATFAFQFFAVLAFGSKLSLAVCPLALAGIAAYYVFRRRLWSAFTMGMLIALCLAFLLSTACGVKMATEGFGG
jgi:hypothetical protein